MMTEKEAVELLMKLLSVFGTAPVSRVASLLKDWDVDADVETFVRKHGFTVEDDEVTLSDETRRAREAERKAKAEIKTLAGLYGASLDDVERILEKYGIDGDVEDFLEGRMRSDFRIEPEKVMPRLFNPSQPYHVDNAVTSSRFIERIVGQLQRSLDSQAERIQNMLKTHYDRRQLPKEAGLLKMMSDDLRTLAHIAVSLSCRDDLVVSFCGECGQLLVADRTPEVEQHMRQAHPGEYPLQSIGHRVQTATEGGGSQDRQ